MLHICTDRYINNDPGPLADEIPARTNQKDIVMKKLEGKVAVVTGASKGIGAGIAKQLAAEGAAVVVNYASSREGADRTVAEIAAAGGKAIAVQGDVSKKEDIVRLFAETKKAFGTLDILVNNAGVYAFTPLEEITRRALPPSFQPERARARC